jgi:hypothetical protein
VYKPQPVEATTCTAPRRVSGLWGGGVTGWYRELEYFYPHRGGLAVQRSSIVRQTVFLTDLANLNRHFSVAVGGHIGKQVVLNLVREVATHYMEELAASKV